MVNEKRQNWLIETLLVLQLLTKNTSPTTTTTTDNKQIVPILSLQVILFFSLF